MAVTNIVPIHRGTTSIQKFIKKKIDYITDRNKTENKTLVSSYMCDPDIADKQFTISKQSYLRNTGRIQKSDVIAYRVMQSFFLDEVTPEKANEIGYKLAEELTKGEHAFIVAMHTNCDNVQDGIEIDYLNGDSWLDERNSIIDENIQGDIKNDDAINFVLNMNSNKIHIADCFYVDKMNEDNRKEIQLMFEELENGDYDPCKVCIE